MQFLREKNDIKQKKKTSTTKSKKQFLIDNIFFPNLFQSPEDEFYSSQLEYQILEQQLKYSTLKLVPVLRDYSWWKIAATSDIHEVDYYY